MITGKTKLFFMIAHPIDHVRSPEVFNPLFAGRGIDAVMVPVHYRPENFEAAWDGLRRTSNLAGFMVSVPHKELAYRLSDRRDESADLVSAANVVRREPDGSLTCANFDGAGFMSGVLRDASEAEGRDALVVGAGGAGASIGFALAAAGVARLRLADLDAAKADDLASRIAARFPALDVGVAGNDPRGHDLIVNATPCGLHPEHDPLPLDPDRIDGGAIVADIIMKPRETPLLLRAGKRGLDVRYGCGMLDMQAELTLDFFRLSAGATHDTLPDTAAPTG